MFQCFYEALRRLYVYKRSMIPPFKQDKGKNRTLRFERSAQLQKLLPSDGLSVHDVHMNNVLVIINALAIECRINVQMIVYIHE